MLNGLGIQVLDAPGTERPSISDVQRLQNDAALARQNYYRVCSLYSDLLSNLEATVEDGKPYLFWPDRKEVLAKLRANLQELQKV